MRDNIVNDQTAKAQNWIVQFWTLGCLVRTSRKRRYDINTWMERNLEVWSRMVGLTSRNIHLSDFSKAGIEVEFANKAFIASEIVVEERQIKGIERVQHLECIANQTVSSMLAAQPRSLGEEKERGKGAHLLVETAVKTCKPELMGEIKSLLPEIWHLHCPY